MKDYAVYILASRFRGATYIGVTSDLDNRIAEHRMGKISGYASRWEIHNLVHVEFFQNIDEAIRREKELKKWRRKWKWELIERNNPKWENLSNY